MSRKNAEFMVVRALSCLCLDKPKLSSGATFFQLKENQFSHRLESFKNPFTGLCTGCKFGNAARVQQLTQFFNRCAVRQVLLVVLYNERQFLQFIALLAFP